MISSAHMLHSSVNLHTSKVCPADGLDDKDLEFIFLELLIKCKQ